MYQRYSLFWLFTGSSYLAYLVFINSDLYRTFVFNQYCIQFTSRANLEVLKGVGSLRGTARNNTTNSEIWVQIYNQRDICTNLQCTRHLYKSTINETLVQIYNVRDTCTNLQSTRHLYKCPINETLVQTYNVRDTRTNLQSLRHWYKSTINETLVQIYNQRETRTNLQSTRHSY